MNDVAIAQSVRPSFDVGTTMSFGLAAPEGVSRPVEFSRNRKVTENNLVDVLAARFPTVLHLSGAESFTAAAHRYLHSESCRSSTALVGETFPCFLRGLGTLPSLQYLADVAELEFARVRAAHAADATPLAHEAFAALPISAIGTLRVRFHPSVSIVSSRFPIVTIWETSQNETDERRIFRHWGPQSALVARPHRDVEMRCLPSGGGVFLMALLNGKTISTAGRAATEQDMGFSLATNLARLVEANIAVSFEQTDAKHASHDPRGIAM